MSILESEFTLKDGVLRFNEEANSISKWVKGPIIKFTSPQSEKLRKWMVRLARAVKAKRGGDWCSDCLHTVTLEFRFCPPPKEKRDVDNYVKPVLDGLAAGLFLPENTDPGEVERYDIDHGVDDSNFRILLIHRLPNAETPEEEGVRLFVSTTGNAPPG